MKTTIKIGTRKSALAMAQTYLVMDAIKAVHPEVEFEIVAISTKGDKILDQPLLSFGGKGVFVTEFEEGIQKGDIDIAVHSAKDMPMELLEGLEIIAVLEREDPRDVLVRIKGDARPLEVIGTSSLRRQLQIKQWYPQAEVKDIRGNVGTRLDKMKQGEYDGIILAAAGLKRLGLDTSTEYEYEYFDSEAFIPSGGQGIIAIEGRMNDPISDLIRDITHEESRRRLQFERAILELLEVGCHEPIGVFSQLREENGVHILKGYIMFDDRIVTDEIEQDRWQELASRMVAKVKHKLGMVYLVGAGPGDPKLITLRGVECLKQCDAVVYDRLASDELLAYVPEDCERINVGKRVGNHAVTQDEINAIIVRLGLEGKTVTRLKGGDSFVFGRGGEEVQALEEVGIPYELVPGVTSSIAVPELAGIPVTHRGVARSFHVITGYTATESTLEEDQFAQYAKLQGTLIFLMAMNNLERITKQLMKHGKSSTTPAAVISNGATAKQKTVRATLETLIAVVAEHQMEAPAIVVIGDVAQFEMKYNKED